MPIKQTILLCRVNIVFKFYEVVMTIVRNSEGWKKPEGKITEQHAENFNFSLSAKVSSFSRIVSNNIYLHHSFRRKNN